MPSETIGKTIAVAAGVCVVCSVFVSTAAVSLKDRIETNKTLDKNKNILIAAGLLEEDERANAEKVGKLFEQIDVKWIDLKTGDAVDAEALPEECLDERKAARDAKHSEKIQEDIAKIKRRAKYRQVFRCDTTGRIVLPVHGKGLWSTMYGFIALDAADLTTIRSFAFYEHGETPGLGGEVDNKKWKKSWKDKKAFDGSPWEPKIEVVKGTADRGSRYQVDGIAGATLTARGVGNLVRFWLGDEGYGSYLDRLREGGEDG